MEPNLKESVDYYSKDFDWSSLQAKYQSFFQQKSQQLKEIPPAKDYETNWEKFYQINQENFFKDRKYLLKSFEEIEASCMKHPEQRLVLLEAGCGVGNTIFPLLRQASLQNLFVYGFDVSETAVKITQQSEFYVPERVQTFVCNILKQEVIESLKEQVDFCTMVFFLSSFRRKDLPEILAKIDKVIRKGGLVMVRDYGLYDLAMLRNERKGNMIEENCFQKGDGIVVQYFSVEGIREVFEKLDYEEVGNEYCTVERENKKTGVNLSRVFINAKFRKK